MLRSVAATALLSVAGLGVPAGDPDAEPPLHVAGSQAINGPAAGAATVADDSVLPRGVVRANWLTAVTLRNFSGDAPLENKARSLWR